jgi:hypothetical protein
MLPIDCVAVSSAPSGEELPAIRAGLKGGARTRHRFAGVSSSDRWREILTPATRWAGVTILVDWDI